MNLPDDLTGLYVTSVVTSELVAGFMVMLVHWFPMFFHKLGVQGQYLMAFRKQRSRSSCIYLECCVGNIKGVSAAVACCSGFDE